MRLIILLITSFAGYVVFGQVTQRIFDPGNLPEEYFAGLRKVYANNKQYPLQLEKQILIALSYYPELKNTPIIFRIRPRHAIGLTRTTWGGLFESPALRHYVITISESTEPALMPILFSKQTFNAQVGMIGHELAHVVQYAMKTSVELLQYVISNISARYVDRFEYNADAICIAHGLGYQLLEWSQYIRKAMKAEYWRGPDYVHKPKKRERYMNPSTILSKINDDPQYRSTRCH